jgi:hypothetical protein
MAAEWYYLSNQKQVGPVELSALQSLVRNGLLSNSSLIFGPGLTEWTQAGQVHGVFGASPAAAAPAAMQADPRAPAMLGYRGVETTGTGLTQLAMDMLRQTKPWVRFIGVLYWIGAGFMFLFGLIVSLAGAALGSRMGTSVPAAFGLVYVAMGALFLMPALFLNRYASRIADLLRTNRMGDLEQALGAQKSFWKFTGILTLIGLCLYAVGIVIVMVIGIGGSKF